MYEERAVRGPLPQGWAWATLGEITLPPPAKLRPDASSDLPFLGMDGIEPHGLRPTCIGRFGDMKSAASAFNEGDVLYGRLRPYLNKVWRAEYRGAASAEFIVFPANRFVSGEFLKFVLHDKRFVNFASRSISGDRPRVDVKDISGYPVAVPPLNEQNRIAARIDELFGEIEAGEQELEKAREALETYRRAVLKAAVTGELTKDWRERNATIEMGAAFLARMLVEHHAGAPPSQTRRRRRARHSSTDAPLSASLDLPTGWVWASLTQLGLLERGKSKHRPRDDPKLYGGRYPFIQTGDVRRSKGRISLFSQTYNEVGLKQSRLWPAGTVCITIAANIASSGILEFDACFPDSVVGLIPSMPEVGKYAEFFMRTAKSNLERFAPATAQKNINLETLYTVAVPLPPETELIQIVRITEELLAEADEVESRLAEISTNLETVRQSILSAAFSGSLVSQDPGDEPAMVLLERIWATVVGKAAHARRSRHQTEHHTLEAEET